MNEPPTDDDPDAARALAGPPRDLSDLTRQLEGSTHGGPRHSMIYESIRRCVATDPGGAIDTLADLPAGSHGPVLMAVSGLGRSALSPVWDRLDDDADTIRRAAAMVVCIWGQRGLLNDGERADLSRRCEDEHDPATRSALAAAARRRQW